MRPTAQALLVTAASLSVMPLTGCLHRRIHIVSDPPGALVHLNDVQVGRTPVEVDFTYFGVYDVRVTKAGYEPITKSEAIETPYYEWPGVDLIAEMIPADIVTEVRWEYTLEPLDADIDGVIERARELRGRLGEDEESEPD